MTFSKRHTLSVSVLFLAIIYYLLAKDWVEYEYYTINIERELVKTNKENALYEFQYSHNYFSYDTIVPFQAINLKRIYELDSVNTIQNSVGKVMIEGTKLYSPSTKTYTSHGTWIFYKDGFLETDTLRERLLSFNNGMYHGKFIMYNPDGLTKQLEGNYKDGLREGVFYHYHADGEPAIEEFYVDDQLMIRGFALERLQALITDSELIEIERLNEIALLYKDTLPKESIKYFKKGLRLHYRNPYNFFQIADCSVKEEGVNYDNLSFSRSCFRKSEDFGHPHAYRIRSQELLSYLKTYFYEIENGNAIEDGYTQKTGLSIASNRLKEITPIYQSELGIKGYVNEQVSALIAIKKDYLLEKMSAYSAECSAIQEVNSLFMLFEIGMLVFSGGTLVGALANEVAFSAVFSLFDDGSLSPCSKKALCKKLITEIEEAEGDTFLMLEILYK